MAKHIKCYKCGAKIITSYKIEIVAISIDLCGECFSEVSKEILTKCKQKEKTTTKE